MKPKTNILILVNTLTSVNSFIYGNHVAFATHTVKNNPKINFIFYTPDRMSIDRARNSAAVIALENNCSHLMFLDDDVIVSPDAFNRLYAQKKDIIAGLTYIRSYPFKPMVFKEKKRELINKQTIVELDHWEPPKNKLSECFAIGFSCALINCDILKAMDPPFFVTGTGHTEDVYFCCKAKNTLKPVPKIFVDASVHTYHFLSPEAVGPSNVKLLRKFYKPSDKNSRNLKYLNICLSGL